MWSHIYLVATLAVGSWPRQGLARLRAKKEAMSKGKCEGMNPHTPKGPSTSGVGVPVDSWMFKEWLQGPKSNGSKSFSYHLKAIETKMFKMGLHHPFGHLKHVMAKRGAGNQIGNLTPNH